MAQLQAIAPDRLIDRAALWVVFLSSLGGALEFYDFIVFGTFAAYISKAFFPANDPTVSLLLTFGLFAAGYLARPVGGIVFGGRGDRIGRRHSFLLSLAIMSMATIGMGLVPSYATGGVGSTVVFIALRLVQGFCLGGELPGAITYAVEVVPQRRATLACGLVFGCVSAGVLVATAVNLVLSSTLSAEAMQDWGWRVAFFIGGLLGVGSWMLRRALEESPAFLRMRRRLTEETAAGRGQRGPLAELFVRHWQRIVVGICATCIVAAFNGLLFAHMGAYLGRSLNYPPSSIGAALNISSAAISISLVVACWIADMVPRRLVFQLGCLAIALGAFPAYSAMVDKSMPLPMLFFWIGLGACATHGTFAAILADLFPTRVRFSGVAFSLNIGAVVFSGIGPLFATWLIGATGQLTSPAFILVGSATLSFFAAFLLPRYSGQIGRDEIGPAAGA
jgi:MHS family proline/betaine transporter-like MFS transporter